MKVLFLSFTDKDVAWVFRFQKQIYNSPFTLGVTITGNIYKYIPLLMVMD
jgi:hypothetical protein